MLGLYILAAILGGGLLVFSILTGAHHDASDVDVTGLHGDMSGLDADAAGIHGGGDAGSGHDVGAGQGDVGALVLGLFKPRNVVFFLAAFGVTGMLLTLTGTPPPTTLGFAIAMGSGAMLLTHAIFIWLRRSEADVDAVSERELEGRPARVVLALAPGEAGRISCLVGGREQYLTARLASDETRQLEAGKEVVILRVENGVAEIIPFDTSGLPPAERG